MAFFEDLGRTLTKVGEVAAEKTKGVAEFTKVNAKILDAQNKLDKAYIQLAKKYLELHPANEEEDMKAVVEAVYTLEDQLKDFEFDSKIFAERLKDLRRQLQDLKGALKCEVCGAQCNAEAVFCSKCGAELKKEEIVFEAEEVFEEDIAEDVE